MSSSPLTAGRSSAVTHPTRPSHDFVEGLHRTGPSMPKVGSRATFAPFQRHSWPVMWQGHRVDLTVATSIAVVAFLFTVFQWRATRGTVRCDLTYGKREVSIRVTSAAPSEIVVERIVLLGTRSRFLSRLKSLIGGSRPMPRRYALSRFFFDHFLAVIVDCQFEDTSNDVPPGMPRRPHLPHTIRPYAGASWQIFLLEGESAESLMGRRDVAAVATSAVSGLSEDVRVRAYVDITGHPKRVVTSRWQRRRRY